MNAIDKQTAPKGTAPTAFITWMGTEKWAEVNGKNIGVYEMINIKNSKYRLFLISLGEQKYGTRLQGDFFNSPDSANLVVNVTPFYPNSEVKELKSYPYLILRTTKEQNIFVRWVDGTGEVKEVIRQYDTDFYDPMADTFIND